MDVERRKSDRTIDALEVKFGNEDEFIVSYILDLGQGGLFIKTDMEFSRGDRFGVSFNLPDVNQSIEADVEVCWVKKSGSKNDGVGLRFMSMNRGNTMKITTYLDQLGIL